MNNTSEISKAVAGGLVSAIIALLARYGWQLDPVNASYLGVVVTVVVGYVVGHVAVYLAPRNKVTQG